MRCAWGTPRPSASSMPIPTWASCSRRASWSAHGATRSRACCGSRPGVGRRRGARGRLAPPRLPDHRRACSSRTVEVLGRRCCELLGHGDVMRPWQWDDEGSHVRAEVGWVVLEPTRLAVLDHGLVQRIAPLARAGRRALQPRDAARPPPRGRARHRAPPARRATGCCSRSGTSRSAGGASRADGVVVPLPLGHQRLADLVGAHRPSVTTAMGELARAGTLSRRENGDWVLHGAAAGGAAPPPARGVAVAELGSAALALALRRRGGRRRAAGGDRRSASASSSGTASPRLAASARWRCARTSAELGHGSASPVVHACGWPLGQRPRKSTASMISQKACTTGSGPPIGRICSAPVIMPSTPMKRVSRPTRIALSEISTIESASASAPGQARGSARRRRGRSCRCPPPPRPCAGRRGSSRSTSCVANDETIVEMPCSTPPTIGR